MAEKGRFEFILWSVTARVTAKDANKNDWAHDHIGEVPARGSSDLPVIAHTTPE